MTAFSFDPNFSTIALYSVAFVSDKTFLLMSFYNQPDGFSRQREPLKKEP